MYITYEQKRNNKKRITKKIVRDKKKKIIIMEIHINKQFEINVNTYLKTHLHVNIYRCKVNTVWSLKQQI